jgi:predicted RNase H-like HicB family nuclease
MNTTIRYEPIETNTYQKSFLFHVHVAPKSNGYWHAWIATLPGCAAVSASQEEAVALLKETARTYVRLLVERGVMVPDIVATISAPVVAVSV